MKCKIVSGFLRNMTGIVAGDGVYFGEKCFIVLLDNPALDPMIFHQTEVEILQHYSVAMRPSRTTRSMRHIYFEEVK